MAKRCFLRSKLHRATLTGCDVDYEGSIAIDEALLRAADMLPNEQVDVYNLDNGNRLTTYAIAGKPGEVCLNGAAALLAEPGQRVIICCFTWLDEDEIAGHAPRVVLLEPDNVIARTK